MGDHLNSGIRNIVVRGPGLNCRRCSSVIGIPRNPKSTRKSRSCWVTDRPCTAYINEKFKNHVKFLQCVFEWFKDFQKGWDRAHLGWSQAQRIEWTQAQTTGDTDTPVQALSFNKGDTPNQSARRCYGLPSFC